MGKIFYVMGKSASGKDTIYKMLLERLPRLNRIVMYTTRPKRDGESNGVEYYFSSEEELEEFRKKNKLIEERTYETIHGPWTYFTADDGQMDGGEEESCLMIGTLESYERTREYFGKERLVPVYVEVEDGIRLGRALDREKRQEKPSYKEVCRRFLADEEDFSEENLKRCEIKKRYQNDLLSRCLDEICHDIEGESKGNGEVS